MPIKVLKSMRRVFTILFLGILLGGKVYSQELKYQALFIYNFTRYIEWPDNNSNEFVIGVVGKSSIYNDLQNIAAGKRVGPKTIVIKKFAGSENISNCQVLFVSSDAVSLLSTNLTLFQKSNTLLVTDKYGSIKKGASINFVVNEGKQRFELSRNAITRTGLVVNTQLTDMAILTD